MRPMGPMGLKDAWWELQQQRHTCQQIKREKNRQQKKHAVQGEQGDTASQSAGRKQRSHGGKGGGERGQPGSDTHPVRGQPCWRLRTQLTARVCAADWWTQMWQSCQESAGHASGGGGG